MRKQDDDLKIDISEIFGGDLSGPSDSIDESDIAAPAGPEAAPPTPAQTENNFQEWMNVRNAELETKAQNLELRLQEMQAQLAAVPPVVEPVPAQLPSIPVEDSLSLSPPTADSPIDFNAPIAPPFMG